MVAVSRVMVVSNVLWVVMARMQLVVPRAVAMAVRMLITTWMRNFQVSRLESFIVYCDATG